MKRTALGSAATVAGSAALLALLACGGPESQSTEALAGADATACVSQLGGACGGNIANACSCAPGLVCTPTSGLPVGDVGGTCQPATCATTACGAGTRCCEVPDANGFCTPRCIDSPVCPALPCRAPLRCVEMVMCIQGTHWDSTLCRCVPNPVGYCSTASDCQGPLPALCVQCANGTTGCAHWACVSNRCQIAYCQ